MPGYNYIYLYPNQNIQSEYFLKKDHCQECDECYNNKVQKNNKNNNKIKDRNEFITECENIMNSSDKYDRHLFKMKFKELYNQTKYNFSLNSNTLNNIINRWRNKTNRFTKMTVLDNSHDYFNRLILLEFRNLYIHINNSNKLKLCEYIIWGNDENIARIGISKNYYIDATFHHPPLYKQLLIFMYKDLLNSLSSLGRSIYILSYKI